METSPLFNDDDNVTTEFLPNAKNGNRHKSQSNRTQNNITATLPDSLTNENADIIPNSHQRLVINEVDETVLGIDNVDDDAKVTMRLNCVYIQTCVGMLRVLQTLLSMIALIVLSTTRGEYFQSYLLLPNHAYYQVMLFVVVFSFLSSATLLFMYTCDIVKSIPYNWPLVDCVLHGVIALLYMLGSTLIACTQEFFHKPTRQQSNTLNNHLLVVVVIGYVTMLVFALTAIHGFQKWRRVVPYRLQREPLLQDLEQFEI